MRRLAIATLLFAGCAVDGNPPDGAQLRALDWNAFVCGDAQRVLIARCAMIACHGASDHALRLYGPGRLRLEPALTADDRDRPLTLDEAHANFASARGLTFGAATTSEIPLLRKPLDPALGGGEHVGGVIFRATDARSDYGALAAWLDGATAPPCDRLSKLR